MLLKRLTAFDTAIESILPDILLLEVKYTRIHQGRRTKEEPLLSHAKRRRILLTLEEMIRSSRVSVLKSRIAYDVFEQLIERGGEFHDAIICAQLANTPLNYFITRDRLLRKVSEECGIHTTTPRGMLSILPRLNA